MLSKRIFPEINSKIIAFWNGLIVLGFKSICIPLVSDSCTVKHTDRKMVQSCFATLNSQVPYRRNSEN